MRPRLPLLLTIGFSMGAYGSGARLPLSSRPFWAVAFSPDARARPCFICCWARRHLRRRFVPLLPRVAVPERQATRPSWSTLLTKPNMLVLAAATLIQSSHAVYYGFGTLYWQRLGFSDATIAWLWAEGAIVEIFLFMSGGRWVERWGGASFLALGGAGGLLRWTLAAYVTSVPAFIVIQPLHALTFAAAHLGAMHYIARAVPRLLAGTAQSLYAAMVSGLGLGLASLAAGWLYGAWGGGAYLAMAVMAGVGATLVSGATARRRSLAAPIGPRHWRQPIGRHEGGIARCRGFPLGPGSLPIGCKQLGVIRGRSAGRIRWQPAS